MSSRCKKFSDSISPLAMPKSNKEIGELLDCLRDDTELYVSSLEKGADAFVNHFRNSVLPMVERKGLLESFESQLTKYARVLDAKTISVFHNYQASLKRLFDDGKQLNDIMKYSRSSDKKDEQQLTVELIKMVYVDFSNLLMIASQTMFALEFYCKILCALGCVKFALRVAREEVIQHNVCWKQLKRFSDKNCTYCETCVVSDTCKSDIDFEALSRIYPYSMKIRQIADYTPKFISFDIRCLLEHHYIEHLEFLLRENTLFYKCLKDVMQGMWHLKKELGRELRSPFIWGDEKRLKDALSKNKDSDFYHYLLGRFYYQKERFDDALRLLKKAKKINPKNADVWRLLGLIYETKAKTKRDLRRALEHFRKAEDLEPSNFDIRWHTGCLELTFGNFSSSIESLLKASEHARTDFERFLAYLTISEAYRIKEMTNESALYLQKSKRMKVLGVNEALKILRQAFEEVQAKMQGM